MKPAGHWLQLVLPAGATSPAEHGTGAAVVDAHADPAGQSEHRVLCASEKRPVGQVVTLAGAAGSGQAEPAGQAVQDPVSPTPEKVPSGQLTMPLPSAFGHTEPAGHWVHAGWPARL
jgi:hypothetical protein